MKAVNKILNILVMVFGLASLVLFFTNFATITTGDKSVTLIGAQLAFGGGEYHMAKSADILFCFWLVAISFVMSIFSGKRKGLRYAVSGVSLVAAVYMLVIFLSGPFKFVDPRPFKYEDITSMNYETFALLLVIAIAVFAILSVVYLLVSDYVEVLESKGEKLTIPKRIVRFFRDYKSEVKKIVWPTFKDVAKNTVVVIVMCLLLGVLIWAVDFGLGRLLELILGTGK